MSATLSEKLAQVYGPRGGKKKERVYYSSLPGLCRPFDPRDALRNVVNTMPRQHRIVRIFVCVQYNNARTSNCAINAVPKHRVAL